MQTKLNPMKLKTGLVAFYAILAQKNESGNSTTPRAHTRLFSPLIGKLARVSWWAEFKFSEYKQNTVKRIYPVFCQKIDTGLREINSIYDK